MRLVFFIASSLIIIFSCSKEPVLNVREGMEFDPDTLMVDSAMRVWELYSWNSGENWRYALMPGTDRIKTANEIYIYDFTVNGREQLKLMLRRLPAGDEVVWLGEEWTSGNIEEIRSPFILPPLLTQYDIHLFSKRNSVTLTVVP